MAGQLIARGPGTWLVRVSVGRRPDTGKRQYLNKTVHGAKKDAERLLHTLLRERDLGILVEGNRITVNEYLDQWLATAARSRLRERTYRDYVAAIDRYVRPVIGAQQLTR